MVLWHGLATMGFAVVVGGLMWLGRRSTGRNAVWRLVNAGGLPKDERLMAAAQERFVRQEGAAGVGLASAGVVVGGLLLLVPGESKPEFVLSLMAMFVGGGVAVYVQHFRAVRAARPDGPRAATLQPRRLDDYLTRREIVGQYLLLVLPFAAIALGLLVLATAEESAARGWVLLIPGLAAIPLAALGIYLQRRVLALNQPAGSADELRWQEALRAKGLREMARILVGVGWLCGVVSLGLFDWPAGLPGSLEWFGLAVLVGGTAIQGAIWHAADTAKGLRRSQAAIQS